MGTPMSPYTKMEKDEKCKNLNQIKNRVMIGSLLYLTYTVIEDASSSVNGNDLDLSVTSFNKFAPLLTQAGNFFTLMVGVGFLRLSPLKFLELY